MIARHRARLWAGGLVVQLVASALVGWRGFPYYGNDLVSTAPAWELPVAAVHLPGIALLTATGQCCGFRNGSVLGPRVRAGHIRVGAIGQLKLAGANLVAWLALIGMGLALLGRSRRPAPARPTPPGEGEPTG